ncbi:BnaA09g53360D [Brassica napus]|uniref:BnaA09g53360D protein n=1 Tax=Brassica napus TaxID=3708 RepID=A0A078IRK9_BRANA|nr:BnaA09g53360D [Brassica napus]
MSSNGEKGMMKRSDFAQKLLDDLRVRKERLSISQDTDNYAYSNRGFKGSNKTRSKSVSSSLLTSGTEDSNQIVPYGRGRSIDLSKALAFALENAGKATRADPSGNASVISFLHEVGKRSLGRSSQQHLCSSSQQQLPMVHVHIKEISKGAQKLNQIIKACSNGLSFRKGRYSIQCGGEEHMEGAIELEQSLRLLVDIQQASSEYITKKQSQNRFKLLEENEDGEEEEEDVRNRNNRKIKEAAKTDIEMRLLALKNKHRRQTSGCEDTEHKPQKGRIPNVVAKLMGIGEFPEEEKETKNNNDASIKSAESLTRRRATQSNEKIVELKDQRNSTSLDLVLHKETQRTTNGINYKDKSQQKDDSNSRKGNKKDGEMTTKNAIRRTSSPTEDKPKAVTRSQEKPLHKLTKSIKKAKLKPERHQEHGVMTNHPPKPVSSVPVIDKAKSLRKSFSHVVVLEKKKVGEVHEAEFREKKNLNGGFCKVMKQPENQKPISREANGKQDQLLRSYNDSNKTKAVEADTCINISEDSGVEKKKDIKDDSILLIAAERVLCQAPSENQHQELIFTDGVHQQAPVSNSDGNSERFSKTVYKASKGEVEAGIPLLEKRQEHHRKQETKETLSENEMNLKKIVVKSQLFLDTFEALFKLNIPLNVLHEVGGNNYHQEDKNLLLDCGYEIMKRKGRFQELKVHPFVKVPISSSKVNSLDHLVRQLSKEFEKLRTYGRECYTESLVEDYLPKVLERDVYYTDPNLNSMWDMGWNDSMHAFIEKDDVIRDVEREVFNGLLEEITRDLICI